MNPDGSTIAVGYPTGKNNNDLVSIFSTATRRRLFVVTSIPEVEISALAFSPDGKSLAIGAEDGTAGIWSLTEHTQTLAYDGQTAAVGSIAFTRDGSSVITASNDGTARVWRAQAGQVALLASSSFQSPIFGSQLLDAGRLGLFGAVRGAGLHHRISAGEIQSVPEGKVLAYERFPPGANVTLDEAGTRALLFPETPVPRTVRARVVSLPGQRTLRVLPPLKLGPTSFSPDDTRLLVELVASQTNPGPSLVVDLRDGRRIKLQGQPTCGFQGNLAWSRDGRRVASGGFCGMVDVWDAASGRLLRQVDEGGELSGVALSPDGTRLLVTSWDSRGTIWDVASGKPLVNLIGHTRGISGVALSRDGRRVLTASLDHTVRLWNAGSGQLMRTFRMPELAASLSFSPDGRWVLTYHYDSVRLWSAATGRLVRVLRANAGIVYGAAFSRDGGRVVTANGDGTARVWDPVTGRELHRLVSPSGQLRSAAFSPDGRWVAAGADDGSVTVWDVAEEQVAAVLQQHAQTVISVEFSADGRSIMSASDDGTAVTSVCDSCRSMKQLLPVARARVHLARG